MSFSIGSVFRAGWESWKLQPWLATGFYLTYLLIMVLPGLFSLGVSSDHVFEGLLFGVLKFLIATFALMGWVFVNIKMVESFPVKWADFFSPVGSFPRFLGGSLLYGALMIVGAFLIFIPIAWAATFEQNPSVASPHHWIASGLLLVGTFLAFYWALIFCFWPYFVLDKQSPVISAFQESRSATHGHRLKLAGLFLLSMGLNLLGALCFLLGLLFTVPLTALIWAHAYKQLRR